MDATQKLSLDRSWIEILQREFKSARVEDKEMCLTIDEVKKQYDYLLDPHSAVAYNAAIQLGYGVNSTSKSRLVAILATASPCKFEESVTVAIGKQNWETYFTSVHFPSSARIYLERKEIPPKIYKSIPNEPLSTIKKSWQSQAVNLIDELLRS